METALKIFQITMFWGWNLLFLSVVLFGFMPVILFERLDSYRIGIIPAQFLVYGLLFCATPLLASIFGLWKLSKQPSKLSLLWFGVEAPIMILLAISFFTLRDVNDAMRILLLTTGLGLVTILWNIFDDNIDQRGRFLRYVRLIITTCLLLSGLYIIVWLSFFFYPAFIAWLNVLGYLSWSMLASLINGNLNEVVIMMFGPPLILFTGIMLTIMPIYLFKNIIQIWLKMVNNHQKQEGIRITLGASAILMLAIVTIFYSSTQQNQKEAFSLLENPPKTEAEAKALINKKELLRNGLLNAYLSPYRYVGSRDYFMRYVYEDSGVNKKSAEKIQSWYNIVASPIYYKAINDHASDDRMQSAELYQKMFDQPILKAEKPTIVNSVRQTWDTNRLSADWEAVDEREVLLTEQKLNWTENGDWAEFELYEQYQNQTTTQQEVVYYFTLPESAVITGLWLGENEKKEDAFVYRVAPRGAAQQVYKDNVQENRDPALLEQIGPQHYRLRIFPILQREWDYSNGSRSELLIGKPMHLWMTWRVLRDGDHWPLPQLTEHFNIYWDETTKREQNSKTLNNIQTWLPNRATVIENSAPSIHRVDFPNGESVVAYPVSAELLKPLPENLNIAVVLDSSFSMTDYKEKMINTLNRLKNIKATGDVYLINSPFSSQKSSKQPLAEFDPTQVLMFGAANSAELLRQYHELHTGEKYDAIFVLTDHTGYELGPVDYKLPSADAPIWMIHFGGLTIGYDDATLQAVQSSGGGSADNLETAFNRLAISLGKENKNANKIVDLSDGFIWETLPTINVSTDIPIDRDFAQIAARRIILSAMNRERDNLDQLSSLDQLHAIAVKYSIATPYSSLIVLVNTEQHRQLDQLELDPDRHNREQDNVTTTFANSSFFNESMGVPEPEEWLLIILALGMLGFYLRRQKLAHSRQSFI